MESTRVGRGFANSRVPKKEEIEYGMEQGEGHQSRVSSSRRTRSQLAPDWTINDSLILVNEIAAVEGECLNALSTYQKWKIIAENCTALDVSRTFNQCRRKWDSLLFEYNKIKKWESRSRNVSFWTLESERRRELGLPVDFERELFKAIDDLVSSQEVRSDTDPGTDPEAEDDRLEVIAEYGNEDLCGLPLEPCKESKKPSILIIALVVGGVVVLAAIIAAVFLICRQKGKASKLGQPSSAKAHKEAAVYEAEHKEVGSTGVYKKGEQGQLYFVRNDRERFELQDLLRASAEVLGSGSFGSSYKAVLLSGPAMVVKRFKQMNRLGSGDFHEHMRRLGRLSHPNLLSLVAFYYKKEEKLLVSDFVPNGSLASHLHSKRAPGQPGLDWPIRLKIIQKVAHALAYLYKELSDLTLPHGHLKSSNVLLDDKFEPVLSDYALVPAINREHAQQIMVAYKSPEFMQYDRTTRKTDVWSLGILILEMLTGKFPANYLKQGKGANSDLLSWVNSVVREEWTGEVFDKDMKGTRNGEGEMLKLLKIGMSCCEWNMEKRWDLKEAVKRIEELKERDSDEDNSSYASEGDIYSSRAMTDDDFSFSVNN